MLYIGVNSNLIKRKILKFDMGQELWFIRMGGHMKVIGAMIKDMVKDMRNLVMEIFLQVISTKEESKAKEKEYGNKLEKSLKANGSKDFVTESEAGTLKQIKLTPRMLIRE